jgi:hypothetical protein
VERFLQILGDEPHLRSGWIAPVDEDIDQKTSAGSHPHVALDTMGIEIQSLRDAEKVGVLVGVDARLRNSAAHVRFGGVRVVTLMEFPCSSCCVVVETTHSHTRMTVTPSGFIGCWMFRYSAPHAEQ